MSEEEKEAPVAKKKGKLPVIIALVAVIGGGGFFAMKMKSGGPKKVEIKAGPPEPLDKEFLVNLKGPNSYLRTEITLEVRDGVTKEELDACTPEIRGAIIQIFRSKTVDEVSASETRSLRKEIATALNVVLIRHMSEEEKKKQKDFEKAAEDEKSSSKKDDGDKSTNSDDKSTKSDDKADDKGEDWVCPAGPVLDIDFTNFTTQ